MDQPCFDALTAALRQVRPDLAGRSIGPEDRMADLGLDSVDRAETLLLALDALEIDAPITRFHGAANLGELADLLNAQRRA